MSWIIVISSDSDDHEGPCPVQSYGPYETHTEAEQDAERLGLHWTGAIHLIQLETM